MENGFGGEIVESVQFWGFLFPQSPAEAEKRLFPDEPVFLTILPRRVFGERLQISHEGPNSDFLLDAQISQPFRAI